MINIFIVKNNITAIFVYLCFQNKTLLMSFLYSGGTSDMSHMQDIEVDPKAATWVCYTLPRKYCYMGMLCNILDRPPYWT